MTKKSQLLVLFLAASLVGMAILYSPIGSMFRGRRELIRDHLRKENRIKGKLDDLLVRFVQTNQLPLPNLELVQGGLDPDFRNYVNCAIFRDVFKKTEVRCDVDTEMLQDIVRYYGFDKITKYLGNQDIVRLASFSLHIQILESCGDASGIISIPVDCAYKIHRPMAQPTSAGGLEVVLFALDKDSEENAQSVSRVTILIKQDDSVSISRERLF